jgi:hypothetical protein
VGRGGAANVFKPSAEEIEKAKRDNAKWESAVGDDDSLKQGATKPKGLADKGKEWLMGRKWGAGGIADWTWVLGNVFEGGTEWVVWTWHGMISGVDFILKGRI